MINYCGDNVKIKNAILVINQEGFLNSLYEMILNTEKFSHTLADSDFIAHKVHNTMKNDSICVNVYYPKWRWSKAIGYFSASKPTQININGYKLKNMSIESIVGNFSHEICHMASAKSKAFKFDHGSNTYNESKKFSAPYLIGNYAKQLVSKAMTNE